MMTSAERIARAIEGLARTPGYCGQIASVHEVPGREASYAPVPEGLHPAVRDWLAGRGIDRLYAHQAEAWQASSAGQDVVIATSTASGKTISFLLPVLDALARDEAGTALFLYPLKALANDQLRVLREADAATGLGLEPAAYDGDTPRVRRPRVRQGSRIVLSNPWEIHETLPSHGLWRRFFANLKYLVIDEAHRYTGVFGSNVAQVLRRLLRVAEAYGARPRIVLATASIANPAEHAERLTSRPCTLVDRDGSPAGPRRVVFWNAAVPDAPSVHQQARDVLAAAVRAGLKTLCFAVARRSAEVIASLALDDGRDGPPLPVAPYRAGYLPEDRRRIEAGLKDGTYRAVVSTSALELGIDVGDLDAAVLAGYPGSVSSFWQQAGRAGRRGEASLAVFVAFDDILDQYLLAHPDVLLGRTYEPATVDLTNEHILAGHLLCAASELPVPVDPTDEPRHAIAQGLAGGGMLHETEAGWVYAGVTRPHEAVRLDRVGGQTVTLVDAEDGEPLETIDFDRALRETFPNAVYLHQGATWVVEQLDLDGLQARLRRRDVRHQTRALFDKQAEVVETRETRTAGPARVSIGTIRMTSRVTRYLVRLYDRVVGGGELDLPERRFETTGLRIELPESAIPAAQDPLGALHALEHTLVGIAPVVLACDPADLAGFATLYEARSGGPAVFVYDAHEGGIGLADRAFEQLDRLLRSARDVLERCPCESGCPACCLSPRCGADNRPMDKAGAAALARALL